MSKTLPITAMRYHTTVDVDYPAQEVILTVQKDENGNLSNIPIISWASGSYFKFTVSDDLYDYIMTNGAYFWISSITYIDESYYTENNMTYWYNKSQDNSGSYNDSKKINFSKWLSSSSLQTGWTIDFTPAKQQTVYYLYYEANASGVTNMPNPQSQTNPNFILAPGIWPQRDGYDFIGWGESPYATWGHNVGATITVTSTETTLYAIWKKQMESATYIQSITASVSGRTIPGTTVTWTANPPSGCKVNYTFWYLYEVLSNGTLSIIGQKSTQQTDSYTVTLSDEKTYAVGVCVPTDKGGTGEYTSLETYNYLRIVKKAVPNIWIFTVHTPYTTSGTTSSTVSVTPKLKNSNGQTLEFEGAISNSKRKCSTSMWRDELEEYPWELFLSSSTDYTLANLYKKANGDVDESNYIYLNSTGVSGKSYTIPARVLSLDSEQTIDFTIKKASKKGWLYVMENGVQKYLRVNGKRLYVDLE